MEFLRRALLVGCCLAGLWLLRLAPLDPLVSIGRIDFAQRQQDEARSVPDDRKTDAERRRAELPLSVYIEEDLQYNVFSASGPEWDRFLATIDAARTPAGASRRVVRRSVRVARPNTTRPDHCLVRARGAGVPADGARADRLSHLRNDDLVEPLRPGHVTRAESQKTPRD
jgi:hypothetical protein